MQYFKRILTTSNIYFVKNYIKPRFIRVTSKINMRNYGMYPIATEVFNQKYDAVCYINCSSFSTTADESPIVDSVTFERVCDETLESLSDYFEQIIESDSHLKQADVSYSSGVLTVSFGEPYGTYVINRQSPNKQIWLSSPTSGPKRYDFLTDTECWVYKHNRETLHHLLQTEIEKIIKHKINFASCLYSKV